jgi:outer membrane protein TolC
MKTLFISWAVVFTAVCWPGPAARAQAETAGADGLKVYRLSLNDATRMALVNSLDIQLIQYDARIARAGRQAAGSIYDTLLEAEVKYRDDQSKKTSTLFGSKTVDNDYNIGLSKKVPTGTTLSVDLENNRHFTNSVFTTAPLTHDSRLGLTVEQALGRNFLGVQDRGDVKIKLADIQNSQYTSLDKIEESVAEVQRTYWDLVLRVEKVNIEEAMVAEAKKLYDLHQEKLRDGLVEVPEAIASEANYKQRKNALLLARHQVRVKVNVLRLLLNIDDEADIQPTEQFDLPDAEEGPLEAVKLAFENRQDYKKARNMVQSADVQLAMKRNNIWPEINLTATLEQNGLGDHFKDAVTKVTDESNPDFFTGLTVSFPLENHKAKGQLQAAELEKAKMLLALKLLERKIVIDVSNHARDCHIYRELALNTREVAALQARKLEEEQRRFGYGRSDTDTLIRFQEDVVRTRGEVAEAVYRYYTALIALRKTEGVLLRSYWGEKYSLGG